MGHVVNPSTGALAFNNTPSTVSDLQALSDRAEDIAANSVATVAALEGIEHPRLGEVRRVSADGTYWGHDGSGWEMIYRPDEEGVFTFAAGISGIASLTRTGNVVHLTISGATRATAWTAGASFGTVTTESMRPAANTPGPVVCSTTGTARVGWVTTAGVAQLFESTDSGSFAMHFTATWTV